jgi:hypothetical protein
MPLTGLLGLADDAPIGNVKLAVPGITGFVAIPIVGYEPPEAFPFTTEI